MRSATQKITSAYIGREGGAAPVAVGNSPVLAVPPSRISRGAHASDALIAHFFSVFGRSCFWCAACTDQGTFMDALTSTAASGLRARMESLDLLANNIA